MACHAINSGNNTVRNGAKVEWWWGSGVGGRETGGGLQRPKKKKKKRRLKTEKFYGHLVAVQHQNQSMHERLHSLQQLHTVQHTQPHQQ